jgi:pyrimidine-nucleoside phosphorylase
MSQEVKEKITKKNYALSPYLIIAKKRDGEELNNDEINFFINEYTVGNIPDYQMSSLLMSIFLNGMSTSETNALTKSMLNSGSILNFDEQSVVDKHSTGGVGDKTSFILAPIAAACEIKVPMISGRGLGHTGGTTDKIESIKNFNTSLTLDQFQDYLMNNGIVLMGQTDEIAPADKKIYALRDVTATVESISLITASIMSKKLAEGSRGLVLDIKVGRGAFMKDLPKAQSLATSLRNTGLDFQKNMMTTISDMSQPTGFAIGHSLEIIECIETLKGNGPKDLSEISLHLAGGMIFIGGKSSSLEEGIEKARDAVNSGKALEKFKELIENQGGDSEVIDNYDLLPVAKVKTIIKSPDSGYIQEIVPDLLGLECVKLGGGRKQKTDLIDHGVGFILNIKIGQEVEEGSTLITIFSNQNQTDEVEKFKKIFLDKIIKISKDKINPPKLIIETQIDWGKGNV